MLCFCFPSFHYYFFFSFYLICIFLCYAVFWGCRLRQKSACWSHRFVSHLLAIRKNAGLMLFSLPTTAARLVCVLCCLPVLSVSFLLPLLYSFTLNRLQQMAAPPSLVLVFLSVLFLVLVFVTVSVSCSSTLGHCNGRIEITLLQFYAGFSWVLDFLAQKDDFVDLVSHLLRKTKSAPTERWMQICAGGLGLLLQETLKQNT